MQIKRSRGGITTYLIRSDDDLMVEVHEVAIILIRQETKHDKQNDRDRDVILM